MIQKPLFNQTFFLLLIIGVSDFLANTLYFYWTVWWFDMVMHFIAGVCVGMASVMSADHLYKRGFDLLKAIKLGIIFSFAIGLLWEVFELRFDIMTLSDGLVYYSDTFSDLVLDVCGGILGALYGYKLYRMQMRKQNA